MTSVLWVTQVYPRTPSDLLGAFLHRLARELPARGFAVLVVAPGFEDAPESEERDGVRIRRFRYAPRGRETIAYTGEMHRAAARHPWLFVQFLRGLRLAIESAAREESPAIIHAHWWIPTGLVASRVSVPARIPLALSLHGTDVRLIGKNPIVRALAGGVFRRTSLVLPVSPALGRELDRLALPVRAREILPMPADPTVFRPGDAEREAPSSARFVVAARLTAQKRVDLALRALARVRQRGLLVRLDIAGDGPERARLSSLARSLGLEGSVLFHGVLSPPELAQLFRQSAAVVLPSEREGYGLVIVEGALCGIPAIGARSGGIEDLIESGATGLLFRPGDVEELASALERLATRFDEARRMGAEACRLAQARTPEPIAERLAGLYGRMIDRPELRPG